MTVAADCHGCIGSTEQWQAASFAERFAWELFGDNLFTDLRGYAGQSRSMADHIGIGCISQRAMALTSFDALAQLIGLAGHPGRAEIIVVFAQVANRLRTDTAGPDIAVRGDLRGCHTGHA